MPAREATRPTSSRLTVAVTTRGGTHTFTTRDRLWVLGGDASESRPVTDVHAGDLVAFLGRVLSVRYIEKRSVPRHDKVAPRADSRTDVPSEAA